LRIGAVLLEVHEPTWPDAALQPSADGAWLDYNRPPRLLPPPRRTVFRLPKEPGKPHKAGLPLAAALAPAVLGVAMAVMFHQPSFLLLALMSPLMLFGQFVSSRREGKKTYRQDMKDWRQTCAAIEQDAADALVAERTARRTANPDAAALLMVAVGPRARLWERRRSDPDHLSLRVGTVDLASEVVVEDPEQLEHRREVKRIAHDVPVAVRLPEAGVLGVAGRGDLPRRIGTWLLGQLAVLQSPRDVSIYVLTESSAEGSWRWATWLPHLHPTLGQDAYALIGHDADTLGRRIAELSQIVSSRQSAKLNQNTGRAAFADPDVVVLLDGARRLRSMPGVPTLLRDGPSVGVYCICLDADERQLPEECGAVVTEGYAGLDVRQQRTADVTGVRADLVPPAWFQRVARAIAPVRDVSDTDDGGALPPRSRLLDVIDLEPPTEDKIVARWNRGGRSTEAVVGESIDGPFAIDLRRDGPHGLVAGTTGSGKSEFLQTLVASLAVANRPDAMTFVLVDYKGGAAFKDCVKLPHTVGMVTDLDTHLVERALTSLGAELTRREHLLAAAGAKDLEDYVDYAGRDASLIPIPRLLIVIDEFASMARELPDFVTGLVNIAQRGRSLGIHLLLATQRPSGVVSPEIRANTNLRIALRVTDGGESTDVIDVPDAAQISKSTPGRAYVQLGHASLVPFQSGRVGGRRPGAGLPAESRPAPWLRALRWSDLGRPAPERPRSAATAEAEITDLAVLVDAISRASAAARVPAQHSPWLPALPELLAVADLASPVFEGADEQPTRTFDREAGPDIPAVPFGLEDIPAAQQQRVCRLNLATFGHLFVAGAPRSGRSQVLRTIAGMLAERTSTADVHIYGIDCGNGALLPLTRLPHCGAVVQRTQTERAARLINRLNAEVQRRQDLLGNGGFADITEQRAGSLPVERLAHLVVLLDRWEGFVPTLGEVDGGTLSDTLFMILREGASVGVHVIISGDRTLLSGRVSTLTDDKLVLRLTDRGDYSLAGLNARTLPEEIAQGRAFRAESGIETHIAVLGADPSGPAQAQCLADIGEAATARDADLPRTLRPFRIDVLPSRLSFADAWGMRADSVARPLWGLVGVGGDELIALGPDLAAYAPTFVIAGPPKSGRSTVLLSVTSSLLRAGTEVLVTAPLSSPLRELAGRPGVRAVLTDDDLTPDELSEHLGDAAGSGPVVLVMDDAEIHKDFMAGDYLRTFIRTAGARTGLVIAGNAAEVCSGFMGWQIDVKKNRSGALLSPQDLTDGDIIGLRLPRSTVGGQVQPGRALMHLGDGDLVSVQVPLLTVAEV
jgi:S-DNA-T family DNA segregation ATPase FtsK/SpoIIIE